jgi:hypothetical protein
MNAPKDDKQAAKQSQRNLAEALREVSPKQGEGAKSSVALRAAIRSLSHAKQSNVSSTLRKIAASQKTPSQDPAFRAAISKAIAKAAEAQEASDVESDLGKVNRDRPKDLASALQQIAAAHKRSMSAPTITHLIELKEPVLPKSLTGANKKAFLAGFLRGLQGTGSVDPNPWIGQAELFWSSASDPLRDDWQRVESDLWTTVEKLTEQLQELPPKTRVHLAKALAQYIRSHAAS